MSNGLPPPPDLLGIAMQAQQVRRQAEQDRLNQLMMVENLRQNAIRQGQDAIAQGIEAKDALGMLSYRDPLVEAQLKAMESAAKKNKEQQLNSQAAQQLIPGLTRLGVEAPNTEAFGQGVSQLAQLLGQDAGPILESITAQSKMAPTLGALDQIQAQQQFEQSLQQLGAQESVKRNSAILQNRATTADRLALEDFAKQRDAVRSARIEQGSTAIAGALARSAQDPQALTNTLMQVQQGMENPALEMPQVLAKANAAWVAGQEPNAIVETYRAQGYNVPKSLARAVTEGKNAAIDEFTGLISVDPGEKGAEMRQSRASSMYQLVEMEEYAKKLVEGPLRGMAWKERVAWVAAQKAKGIAGGADPLYVEFAKRQENFVASLARATFTGQMSNQERSFAEGLVLSPMQLAGDKSGTGLSPQAKAGFNTLYSSLYSRYRTAIPRGVFSDKQLRDSIENAKKTHAEDVRKNVIDVQYPSTPDASGWQSF